MILLLALTQWQRVGLSTFWGVICLITGALLVRAFMRGARADRLHRQIERDARARAEKDAGLAALVRSRELWRVRSQRGGETPPAA